MHKECWIFYEPEYETLRSAPGNESFGDLPETITDVAEAKRIALGLGVAEQDIKQFTKMSTNSIQQIFRDGTQSLSGKAAGGGRSLLLVYVAGHGVSDKMQYYVLNDAVHNLINMEDKLRTLAKSTGTSVLALYDVFRSDKSKFPNIKRAIQPGISDRAGFAENY